MARRAEHAERFESQATGFDRRAGLHAEASRAVAVAVAELLRPPPADVVVEVGAGTGAIGSDLAALPVRYVGIDSAAAMLEVFAAKIAGAARCGALLVHADADDDWPVRDGAATVVLASRVAHLLRPDHLVAELARVCPPGGVFLIGRLERDPDSVRSRLRRQREAILQRRGLAPRAGGEASRRLLDRLVATGASPLPRRTAATWTTAASAEQVLAGWGAVTAMGGVELPPAVRAEVLSELRAWAAAELGDLTTVHESAERYTFDGVRFATAGRPQGASGRPRSGEDTWTTRC